MLESSTKPSPPPPPRHLAPPHGTHPAGSANSSPQAASCCAVIPTDEYHARALSPFHLLPSRPTFYFFSLRAAVLFRRVLVRLILCPARAGSHTPFTAIPLLPTQANIRAARAPHNYSHLAGVGFGKPCARDEDDSMNTASLKLPLLPPGQSTLGKLNKQDPYSTFRNNNPIDIRISALILFRSPFVFVMSVGSTCRK